MSDKLKIVSVSLEPEMHDLLKNSAKKLGISVSLLIRELVNKYLDLMVNDSDEVPVILRIPSHLKSDADQLKQWLAVKTNAITTHLTSTADK